MDSSELGLAISDINQLNEEAVSRFGGSHGPVRQGCVER